MLLLKLHLAKFFSNLQAEVANKKLADTASN
jgi:hypothetical protein